MKKKDREIFRRLQEAHPDARCELDHETPFQLLVSTVLSAQATDVQVNKVTKDLYAELPDCAAWLNLEIPEIEERIKSIGLYKSKAKNIHRLVRQIMEDHNGEVPHTMEELTALSGVGRKTASVVLANAFNIPAFAVDTHVFRLANRIGITDEKDAGKTEQALLKAVDRDMWILCHHLLIFHGRRICSARNPKCGECNIADLCKYYKTLTKKTAGKAKAQPLENQEDSAGANLNDRSD